VLWGVGVGGQPRLYLSLQKIAAGMDSACVVVRLSVRYS
jgi:hypothetical protein